MKQMAHIHVPIHYDYIRRCDGSIEAYILNREVYSTHTHEWNFPVYICICMYNVLLLYCPTYPPTEGMH